MIYTAIAKNGGLNMGSDYNRANFRKWLQNHDGARVEFHLVLPESRKLRGYFEGAIVPLFCFYQEGMNHLNQGDLEKCREWLKIEYNGEIVVIKGKAHKMSKSTKGRELAPFVERVLDGLGEQGYPVDVLIPDEYKKWRDTIFPYGGPENYIDYLLSIGKIRRSLT